MAEPTAPATTTSELEVLSERLKLVFTNLSGLPITPRNMEKHPAILEASTSITLSHAKTLRGREIGNRRNGSFRS